jgi:signal transduction histidine kinase
MITGHWQWLKRLPAVLAGLQPEPAEHARRQLALQRNVLLPARLIVVAIVFYQLFGTRWLAEVVDDYGVMFETIQNVLWGYTFLVIAATVLFFVVRRFPPGTVPWIVFAIGLGDGVFLGGLTVLTGGFESILYWVYPVLIVLNAVSIPLAAPQIVLNLLLGIFFLSAGLIESSTQPDLKLGSLRGRLTKKLAAEDIEDPVAFAAWLKQSPKPMDKLIWAKLSESTQRKISAPPEAGAPDETLRTALVNDLNAIFAGPPRLVPVPAAQPEISEATADPYILRVAVLLLLTFCCYGVQVLAAGQKRAEEEQREFVGRTEQLRSAGRLGAEVAHQIKNPLAIINNVIFSLQKNLQPLKPEVAQQLEIVREEIAKADRIITQVMGYAQLSEGRVERLNVVEELHRIIAEVFPPGLPTGTRIQQDCAAELPPLLMQRQHFTDAVGNLLQNARDAVAGGGHIFIRARLAGDDTIEVTVRDDGPGIPPDKRERIFEAYYTTKPRGTGLGLAVVKHNTELYGGSVQLESELGKGSQFTLGFPAKTLIRTGS